MGCPSLLHWSSLHHNLGVIHRLAPLSLSSAAVVSPGLRRCWMVVAPLLLVGSSGVQRRSSWTSAVTSPQAPSLGLDLLVSCVAPLCDQGLQMQVCSYYSGGSGQSCICKAPGNRKALVEAVICHGSTHRLLKKQVNTVGAIPWC